ncbi:TAXI family TRAP transporter solute-binding subunit [Rugosimonospora acidiphila]|uniref:TAXI family TRAP transporter solute-binding subunit n=2 Tax=Rugosimonospora acidiphila TaxID=556531 RepID=A0ABP9SSM8_9ACTN
MWFLLALAAAVVLPAGCSNVPRDQTGAPEAPVVIATGATLGVYYQYAQAFAQAAGPGLGGMRLLPTLGSVDNLELLGRGEATFAFTAADAAADAYDGIGSFHQPVPLRAVARVYDDYIHLVVPAESPIHDVAGLRGQRVSVGPDGSGTVLIAERILSATGIDPVREIARRSLSINDSVTAMEEHRIDAFFWSGGLKTEGITELARHMPIRLVSLADASERLRQSYGASYRLGTIPAGTYPGVDTVATVAVPNLLVALESTPADLVSRVVTALFANAATISDRVPAAALLDRRVAIFTGDIPLHAGALGYYRSVKMDR